ncbi:ABC transporter substrate-binding protein [Actinomadura gamaensis]|uniref:ABC transporter substrate-binding protein n=1 Tax=Actinomadura gamaensis TaxID=1763541 RepID=A0ABV9U1C1_9ACTN
MRKTLTAIGVASTVAVAATACGTSDASSETTLRVGSLGATEKALFLAAGQDKGTSYRIKWSTFPAGPQLVEAEKAGAVDVGLAASTPSIFAQASGAPIKAVAVLKPRNPALSAQAILVPKDSPIKTVADLRGKKVAVTQGTILQYLLIKALAKNGLSYKDVKPVNLQIPDALTAFKRGDVDAWSTIDPYRAQAEGLLGARAIETGAGYGVGAFYSIARAKAVGDAKLSPALRDFVKRTAKAHEWANANPDAWANAYSKANNVPLPLAKALLGRGSAVETQISASVIADQQAQADSYFQLGLLPRKLDVHEEFDTRFNSEFAS